MSIGNSPSADRPSVGRALAQARIAAGLSIDHVGTSTRVRVPILQSIEQDDFSRCGGDVYARGHIRTIARAVGLDPEPLVEQYVAEHGSTIEPVPVAPLYEAERIRSEPRRPNWTAAMVAAIVAVVGFVGFTLVHSGGSGDKTTAAPTTSASKTATASATTPAQGSGVSKPQPSGSAIAAAPPGKVTVKASAESGTSWIQATDGNGKQLFQDSLKKGESKTWTADKQIRLVVGNAGAVQLFVNGKDLGPAGTKGQVVRLTYTPGDPTQG
ncbi:MULTISPECIES: helix-turn-helix domain-containing protein [unclassified Streptomyces]|uniref:helix-turn-helix domain-containing protein n=1 Tax=unclassified Streptomyces TaxID=2593676 RepID=UPI002E2A2271|nr:helix-turn-helix domain-containing protein [Streptomyces sp. NBC_00223]